MEIRLDQTKVITAREIKEFVFCPVGWVKKRAGAKIHFDDELTSKEDVKRQLKLIAAGRTTHQEIAEKAKIIRDKETKVREETGAGVFLLLIAFVLIFFFLLIR